MGGWEGIFFKETHFDWRLGAGYSHFWWNLGTDWVLRAGGPQC